MIVNGRCDPASVKSPFGTLPAWLVAALVCSVVAFDIFPILLHSGTTSDYPYETIKQDTKHECRHKYLEVK